MKKVWMYGLTLALLSCQSHRFHVPFEECFSYKLDHEKGKAEPIYFISDKSDEVFTPMAGHVSEVREISENHYEVEVLSATDDTVLVIGPLATKHRLVDNGDILLRGQMLGHASDKVEGKPVIQVSLTMHKEVLDVKHKWFEASHFKHYVPPKE